MTEQQVPIFISSDGQAQLEVALERNTAWLSQAQMGQLFNATPENVLMHLQSKRSFHDVVDLRHITKWA